MEVKQVIVMRKYYPDGKGGLRQLRKGKSVSQGAHASNAFLLAHIDGGYDFSSYELEWMHNGRNTKICLQVDTEQDLERIYDSAKNAGLTVHMITDSGVTEFNSEPTKTCLAIGPNKSDDIDKVTGKLELY